MATLFVKSEMPKLVDICKAHGLRVYVVSELKKAMAIHKILNPEKYA